MNIMKGIPAITFLIVFTGLTGMDALGFLGFGGTTWQEEVLLHNGSKIIVERTVDSGGRHEVGQSSPIKEQRLTFTLPSTKQTVTWKIEYCKEVGYADLSPIMLEIINKTPYLVTHPVACLAYNKWKRPNPPYIVFRYTNKDWQQIELQELPLELKIPNLIISSPDREVEKANTRFISAEKVKKLNSSFSEHPNISPEYQTILREPLVTGKNSASDVDCPEYVYDGHGGWVGIGWFKKSNSYEECLQQCDQHKVNTEYCPCGRLFKGDK